MNFFILRNIYRYREEMIIKLTEFVINISKQMTNFHISNCLLQLIEFIKQNEIRIKKSENNLLNLLISNAQDSNAFKGDRKILESIIIQILKFYQKTNQKFDQYIQEKNYQNLLLFKKIQQKNNTLRINQDIRVAVETQRTFLAGILDHLKSQVVRFTNNIFNAQTLEIAKVINQFIDIVLANYSLMKQNLKFQFKNTKEEITSLYVNQRIFSNPNKGALGYDQVLFDMVPLTHYYHVFFERMMMQNRRIQESQQRYKKHLNKHFKRKRISRSVASTPKKNPFQFLKILIEEDLYINQSQEVMSHIERLNNHEQIQQNKFKQYKKLVNEDPVFRKEQFHSATKSPRTVQKSQKELGECSLPKIYRFQSIYATEKKTLPRQIQNQKIKQNAVNLTSPFIVC